MSRQLWAISADDPADVLAALRAALAGDGPAILPLPDLPDLPDLPELPIAPRGSGGSETTKTTAPDTTDAHLLGEVPLPVAVVIETSGSTDAPKRVVLSTDALLAGAAATSVALGGPGQWLLALPAHYVAGVQVLVRSIAAETLPVILPPGHFDPLVFAECAEQLIEPLRYTSLVPVQLARLVDAVNEPAIGSRVLAVLRRFTAILVGGQAMRPELILRARELGVNVVRTYGSSETSGGCVYDGLPIGNTAVRVSAEGESGGELEISGSVLAEGYLDDPVRTADRFIDDHGVRWYRTGDLGEVDADTGVVRVLGRADNVIISGGVKVSLDAVERTVRTVAGFGDAVVVPAADAEWGHVPVVVVARDGDSAASGGAPASDSATRVGASADVDSGVGAERRPTSDRVAVPVELAAAVASVLGKAARPARVVTVASIPMLASGKPDRQALRELVSRGEPAEP